MNFELRAKFWEGKRVFITGHTGFKGTWLSLWLTKMGAQVIGYALDGAGESDFSSIKGDIRDLEKLKASLLRSEPQVVIHMAAQSLVGRGYADPVETYSTN